jgi:hypothetical protein
MEMQYAWRADDRYYATVVDNYYRQVPLLLYLRSQAILMWIVLSSFTLSSDLDFRTRWVFIGIISAFAYIYAPFGETRNYPEVPPPAHIWCGDHFSDH